jgi:hypothetical protein
MINKITLVIIRMLKKKNIEKKSNVGVGGIYIFNN